MVIRTGAILLVMMMMLMMMAGLLTISVMKHGLYRGQGL